MTANQLIYWEKQDSDQLCGLHCLNSLLQAPIFNEIDLAEIGQLLDQDERNLLENQEIQSNVNESGNFTFQVLLAALHKIGQFEIVPIRSAEIKKGDFQYFN